MDSVKSPPPSSSDFHTSEATGTPLFKSREEKAAARFDKGSDLISQGQFAQARDKLLASVKKGNDTPEVKILLAMLDYQIDPTEEALQALIGNLEGNESLSVSYGVHTVDCGSLLYEMKAVLEVADARRAIEVKREAGEEIAIEDANRLIQAGNEIMGSLGSDSIRHLEVFEGRKVTGHMFAAGYIAEGYEVASRVVAFDDPKKGAEYAQQAAHFRKEEDNLELQRADEEFVEGASMTAHCWICGREVTGRDIHFVAMPSSVTRPLEESESREGRSFPSYAGNDVYVCRGCFSAIDNSDRKYYGMSKEYTDLLREHTDSEIQRIDTRIDDLISNIRKMRFSDRGASWMTT